MRLVCIVLLLAWQPGWAQQAPAADTDMQLLVEQLNAALEERDAVILELLARVEALEAAVQAGATPVDSGTTRAELEAATLSAEDELDDVDRLAQSALERALIDTGGLLLPEWTWELEPSLVYSMTSAETVDIDCLLIADILCIGDINSRLYRRESYVADLRFRLGLPWDMQFDVRAPFGHDATSAVFGNGTSERADVTELGDIEIGFSRQLMKEKGWRPDLLAELRWKDRSGGDPFDQDEGSVATGTGFDDLRLGFTLVKVRDPIVLFSNLSYTRTFSDGKPEIGRVKPGDTVAAQLGLAIALNLETSMNFGWNQSWTSSTRIDGEKIPGTSRRPGTLNIGATYVPTLGRSINFDVGFGLTDDAPDVTARFSFPMRLGGGE